MDEKEITPEELLKEIKENERIIQDADLEKEGE